MGWLVISSRAGHYYPCRAVRTWIRRTSHACAPAQPQTAPTPWTELTPLTPHRMRRHPLARLVGCRANATWVRASVRASVRPCIHASTHACMRGCTYWSKSGHACTHTRTHAYIYSAESRADHRLIVVRRLSCERLSDLDDKWRSLETRTPSATSTSMTAHSRTPRFFWSDVDDAQANPAAQHGCTRTHACSYTYCICQLIAHRRARV